MSYAKKQTNIMRHRSWHTGGFVMRERVAEAEAKAAETAQKAKERQQEREREMEKAYYDDLAADAQGVKRRDHRLDWMYEFSKGPQQDSGVAMVAEGKIQAGLPQKEAAPAPAKTERAVAVDLENKIREDPMFAMQQAKMRAVQAKFSDPMFVMALKKQRERQERAARGEAASDDGPSRTDKKKKEKKEKKDKKKKKSKKKKSKRKRRRGSSSDSSSDSSDSESSSESSVAARRRRSRSRSVERRARDDRRDDSGRDRVNGHARRTSRSGSCDRDRRRAREEHERDARDRRVRDRSRSEGRGRGRRDRSRSRSRSVERRERRRDERERRGRNGSGERRRERSGERRDRRSRSRSDERWRGRDERDRDRVPRDASRRDAPAQAQGRPGGRPRRPVLSEEEKARQLREMEESAKQWDGERQGLIEQGRDKDQRELDDNKQGGAAYLRNFKAQAMNQTMEERVSSTAYYTDKNAPSKR